MKRPGKPPGGCIVCSFMKKHKNADFNRRIVEGVESIASIARDFGCATSTMERHAGKGKDKDGNPRQPHFAKDINVHNRLKTYAKKREAEAGLDLMRCAKEIYDDCRDNAKKSKEKAGTSRDYRDASGCWDAATKALGILKPEDKPPINTNINLTADDLDGKLKGLLDIIDEASSDRTCRSEDSKDV